MKTANGLAFLSGFLVVPLGLISAENYGGEPPPPHPILDWVGRRSDKNSVGHGRNELFCPPCRTNRRRAERSTLESEERIVETFHELAHPSPFNSSA